MKTALKRVGLIIAGMLLWSLLFNSYWHLRYALEEYQEQQTGCTYMVVCGA